MEERDSEQGPRARLRSLSWRLTRQREGLIVSMLPYAPALVFVLFILIGAAILAQPFARAGEGGASAADALFAAASAVTTTGLSTGDAQTMWTEPGRFALVGLAFAGGLAFTLLAGALLVNAGMAPAADDRGIHSSSANHARLGLRLGLVFVGAQLLAFFALLARFGVLNDPLEAIKRASSLAILSFNNAGFMDISGLSTDGRDWWALGIAGTAAALGALGCVIILDAALRRRWAPLTLTTKVSLTTLGAVAALGAVCVFALEFENPATMGEMGVGERAAVSAFEGFAARTSGISAMDYADAERPTLLLMMALMAIGGAPASLAGGLKATVVALLVVSIVFALKGLNGASLFHRAVSFMQVKRAMALFLAMALTTMAGVMALSAFERGQGFEFIEVMFETVSALSLSGLSVGVSEGLSDGGKVAMAAMMFAGRVFPLTAVLLMLRRGRVESYAHATERVTIG